MRTITRAVSTDWDEIQTLLQAAQLPLEDLGPEKLQDFLVAREQRTNGDKIVGLIGIQLFGQTGMLRSLVVAESTRGSGLGKMLVDELESSAIEARIRELWLLTNDADGYFVRHGYEVRIRDDAPSTIRQTEEFSTLCPDTAFLLSKQLMPD